MSHTPGPWHYDSNVMVIYGVKRYGGEAEVGKGTEYHGADCNSFYEICTIKRHSTWDYWLGDEHYKVPEEVKRRLCERDASNARLVAAAPEMLAALISIRSSLLSSGGSPMPTLDAVIAKATGDKQ